MAGAVLSVSDATDQHSFLTVGYQSLMNIILKATVTDGRRKLKQIQNSEIFPLAKLIL